MIESVARRHSSPNSHGSVKRSEAPHEAPSQAPAASATPAGPKDVLVVADYNVENMFGVVEPGHDPKDQPIKSRESMAAAARILQSTNADVVALEEVQNKEVLDTFVDQFMTGNPYPYRVLVPGNDPRNINVAIISKYPITNVVTHKDNQFPVDGQNRPAKFGRDFLQADIEVNGKYALTMGVVHLKAHAGGDAADAKRLGEAREIRRILLDEMKQFPNKRYMVTGDFNDPSDSPAVRAIKGKDEPKFTDAMEGSKEPTHPPTQRRIDLMLMSPTLARTYVVNSAHVVVSPDERAASDHRPVVAEFKLP